MTNYYVRGDSIPALSGLPTQNEVQNQIAFGSVIRYLGQGNPLGSYFNHPLETLIPILRPKYSEVLPPLNIDISGM